MRKTFSLIHEKIKPARRVDAIKHELKKYLKRERNKTLPQGADFWDFDCRLGESEISADVVHVSQLNKGIDDLVNADKEQFYVEILAKPATREFIEQDD